MSDNTNEEYKGSGKVIGTLGGANAGQLMGAATGTAIAGYAFADAAKNVTTVDPDKKMLEILKVAGEKHPKKLITAIALSAAGLITGAIYGFRKTSKGQAQHEELVNANKELESKVAVLEAEKSGLADKVKWTEKTAQSNEPNTIER